MKQLPLQAKISDLNTSRLEFLEQKKQAYKTMTGMGSRIPIIHSVSRNGNIQVENYGRVSNLMAY